MALSHNALKTRWSMQALLRSPVPPDRVSHPVLPRIRTMGLQFSSPVCLAAGFDRTGLLTGIGERIGFGAIELGSLAAGSRDLSRTMAALRIRHAFRQPERPLVVGVSLTLPIELSGAGNAREVAASIHALGNLADYVMLNPGRAWSSPIAAVDVVTEVCEDAPHGRTSWTCRPRILVKLTQGALTGRGVGRLASAFAGVGAAGLLISAEGSNNQDHLALLRQLRMAIGPSICLISVGGIETPGDAVRRLAAGADLIQVHGAMRRSRRIRWLRETTALLSRTRQAWERDHPPKG